MSCHIFLTWPEKYRDQWELPSCANVCLFGTGAGAKLRSRCHVPWMPWMLQEGSGPGGYPARHGATPKWMVYVMEHPKVDIVNMDEKNRASPVASFIDIYIYICGWIFYMYFLYHPYGFYHGKSQRFLPMAHMSWRSWTCCPSRRLESNNVHEIPPAYEGFPSMGR